MLNSSDTISDTISLSQLRVRIADIRQQTLFLRAISNRSEGPLTSISEVMSSIRRDLSMNVLRHLSNYSSGSEGHRLRCEAECLEQDIADLYEQVHQAVDSSPRLVLNTRTLPYPPVLPSIPSVHTPSPLAFSGWQYQMDHLVRGGQVYPRALNSMPNTCAEQALCTAAFIFNEQANVDLTRPHRNNGQIDLIEMVQSLNPANMPTILTEFNIQNMNRLQKNNVYIVRMGENGGAGHNVIWFCWNNDWYQSASTSMPAMRLTANSAVTQQAANYFRADSGNRAWGYSVNQYSITVLGLLPSMPSILCTLVNNFRQTP